MRRSLLAARHNTKTTVPFLGISKLECANNETASHDSIRVLVELSAIVVACSGTMQRATCGIERYVFGFTS